MWSWPMPQPAWVSKWLVFNWLSRLTPKVWHRASPGCWRIARVPVCAPMHERGRWSDLPIRWLRHSIGRCIHSWAKNGIKPRRHDHIGVPASFAIDRTPPVRYGVSRTFFLFIAVHREPDSASRWIEGVGCGNLIDPRGEPAGVSHPCG